LIGNQGSKAKDQGVVWKLEIQRLWKT